MWIKRLWLDPGPDRGWSWVIVVSSLVYSSILQGIFKAQGYLFVATVESYGVSRQEASWPFVVFFATAHISGVLAGPLNHYLSTRQIMLICGALMSLGYSICFAAPASIPWMTFGYGVVAGITLGITFASQLLIVNQYVEKYRTTANQLLMSGLGLGGLIYPFFIYYLLTSYGLRGSFLVLCAFTMNCFVASALLRPRTPKQFPSLAPQIFHVFNHNLTAIENLKSTTQDSHKASIEETQNIKDVIYNLAENTSIQMSPASEVKNYPEKQKSNIQDSRYISKSYHSFEDPDRSSHSEFAHDSTENHNPSDLDEETHKSSHIGVHNPPVIENNNRDDTHFLENNSSVEETIKSSVPTHNTTEKYNHEDTNILDNNTTGEQKLNTSVEETSKSSYSDLIRSLFRDPMFYIITVSSLCDIVAWGIFFMTVVDYAIDRGMRPGLATMLLPTHSAAELIVRLGTGWITDNGYIGIKRFHLASVVLTGVFFALYPFAYGDGLFFAFACVLGGLYGTSTGSRLVLYVDYLEVSKVPTANGVLLFLAGVVFLGVPQLLGLLRDTLGSYDMIYVAQGVFCLLSAFTWVLEPIFFSRSRVCKITDKT